MRAEVKSEPAGRCERMEFARIGNWSVDTDWSQALKDVDVVARLVGCNS